MSNHLYINGQKLRLLGESPIRRENHGSGWMEGAEATWSDDRFLIFEDDMGLAIVDGRDQVILLNQVFTGYTEFKTTLIAVELNFNYIDRVCLEVEE